MNYTRLTSALLVGVFALIVIASSAHAQRTPRFTPAPNPPTTPVASKR